MSIILLELSIYNLAKREEVRQATHLLNHPDFLRCPEIRYKLDVSGTPCLRGPIAGVLFTIGSDDMKIIGIVDKPGKFEVRGHTCIVPKNTEIPREKGLEIFTVNADFTSVSDISSLKLMLFRVMLPICSIS